MYVITYKGKPQTVEQIKSRERKIPYKAAYDSTPYHAGRTKGDAIADFINHHGFTWPEWKKDGYAAQKAVMV